MGQPFVGGNIQISKGCSQIIIFVMTIKLTSFSDILMLPATKLSCVWWTLHVRLTFKNLIGTEHTAFASTITSTSTYAVDYWYYTLTC